nr:MAG TPA: hypothetical protein [Caudoviricetes sp.]
MSNNISTMYTKDKNQKAGRKGYGAWKKEKLTAISPAAYGDYILQNRKRGKKR